MVRWLYARFSSQLFASMTLRRIAEITGRPVPALSAANLSSSNRLPDRSPGRTQLSVRSTSAKPASATCWKTSSQTLASASLTLRPRESIPGNCSRAPDMGQVWAVYLAPASTIITPVVDRVSYRIYEQGAPVKLGRLIEGADVTAQRHRRIANARRVLRHP